MKKLSLAVISIVAILSISACGENGGQNRADSKAVERQQSQYAIGQPIPQMDWSLERDLVIQLYHVRNQKAATHSVWRSDRGLIEGDCPSYGYGIPYDTSLTNPLAAVNFARTSSYDRHVVEQPEPNGIFASKNTQATWVMCLGLAGKLEPVYVETKVTVYPGPVTVDYKASRVTRSGAATVFVRKK